MYLEVYLTGGLGNQMFQYSAAIGAATKLKADKVFINLSKLGRPCDLKAFRLLDFVSFENAPKDGLLKKKQVYKETNYYFDSNIWSNKLPLVLDGYFQSYKYFDHCKKLIDDSFKLIQAENISAPFDSISIHIRRGDYFSNPEAFKIHGTLGFEYYNRGVKILNILVPGCPANLFTDDVEYVKSNFKSEANINFMEPDNSSPAFDLVKMSKGSNFLIANSTYSWWAAWLGRNGSGLTIAPKNWFSRDFLNKNPAYDLLPDDWILL